MMVKPSHAQLVLCPCAQEMTLPLHTTTGKEPVQAVLACQKWHPRRLLEEGLSCRSWLERQQNCPTCRASVFAPPPAARAPAAPAEGADPAAGGAAGQDRVRTSHLMHGHIRSLTPRVCI